MSKTPEQIEHDVIDYLKTERLKQGLSHDVIAEITGLHRSSISLIESKKRSPTFKNLIKISQALSLELSDILLHLK